MGGFEGLFFIKVRRLCSSPVGGAPLTFTLGVAFMKWKPRNNRKYVKSRWARLTKSELKMVIRSAAIRERNKPRHTRIIHRRTRLEAVAFYRDKFGNEDFLKEFSERKLPIKEQLWLPGGFAYFKMRNQKNENT